MGSPNQSLASRVNIHGLSSIYPFQRPPIQGCLQGLLEPGPLEQPSDCPLEQLSDWPWGQQQLVPVTLLLLPPVPLLWLPQVLRCNFRCMELPAGGRRGTPNGLHRPLYEVYSKYVQALAFSSPKLSVTAPPPTPWRAEPVYMQYT